jgi:hypothetical protein
MAQTESSSSTNHVVTRGDELHGATREFGALVAVPPVPVAVQVREVRTRYVVQHAADVASEKFGKRRRRKNRAKTKRLLEQKKTGRGGI